MRCRCSLQSPTSPPSNTTAAANPWVTDNTCYTANWGSRSRAHALLPVSPFPRQANDKMATICSPGSLCPLHHAGGMEQEACHEDTCDNQPRQRTTSIGGSSFFGVHWWRTPSQTFHPPPTLHRLPRPIKEVWEVWTNSTCKIKTASLQSWPSKVRGWNNKVI